MAKIKGCRGRELQTFGKQQNQLDEVPEKDTWMGTVATLHIEGEVLRQIGTSNYNQSLF